MKNNINNITVQSLSQSGSRSQRWLSLPESRIVINPLSFSGTENRVTHPMYSDRPSMPLNLGYLDPSKTDGTGRWLEDFLTFYEKSPDKNSGTRELWNEKQGEWQPEPGLDSVAGEDTAITVRSDALVPWQYISQRIEFDSADAPTLTVTICESSGSWALKLCEDEGTDVTVQGDTNLCGTFTYPLNNFASVSPDGYFRGQIKLFCIGHNKTLRFRKCGLIRIDTPFSEAAESSITWHPHKLTFHACYPGGLAWDGTDIFADTETVIRSVTIRQGGTLSTALRLPGRVLAYSADTITTKLGGYVCTVSYSNPAETRFYKNHIDFLAGENSEETPDEESMIASLCFGTRTLEIA